MRYLLHAFGGLLLGASLVGALALVNVGPRMKSVREGWALKEVLVAAVEVAEGSELTADSIAVRAVPEQFVSPTMVPPEEASQVVGRRTTIPLHAGDPLVRSGFETLQAAPFMACVRFVKPVVEERGAAAAASALEPVVQSARRPTGDLVPLEPPLDGKALVATKDLEEGSVLEAGDLANGTVPEVLRTASLVPVSDEAMVLGARLVVTVQKGDPLQWQMLDDPEHPSTAAGCEVIVAGAHSKARDAAAMEAARTWGGAQDAGALK